MKAACQLTACALIRIPAGPTAVTRLPQVPAGPASTTNTIPAHRQCCHAHVSSQDTAPTDEDPHRHWLSRNADTDTNTSTDTGTILTHTLHANNQATLRMPHALCPMLLYQATPPNQHRHVDGYCLLRTAAQHLQEVRQCGRKSTQPVSPK